MHHHLAGVWLQARTCVEPPAAARTPSHTAARSSAVFTNHPTVSSSGESCMRPPLDTAPNDGLKPSTPQNAAGRMMEPIVCEPTLSGTMHAATAAAEPEELPPGLRDRSARFLVAGGALEQYSVRFVLPMMIAPAWLCRVSVMVSADCAAALSFSLRWPLLTLR
jgi:hypothetical protein